MADCIGLVAEFTHKLCKKHNLNLVFSGEGELGKNSGVREIHFYKHFMFLFCDWYLNLQFIIKLCF